MKNRQFNSRSLRSSLILPLFLLVACGGGGEDGGAGDGDGDDTMPGDGDGDLSNQLPGDGDGDGDVPTPGDGDGDILTPGDPPITADTCGPAASVNDAGILSPYPNIQVSLYPDDYSLLSFNLFSVDDGDDRGPLLRFYAELRNDSAEERCSFSSDVYLGFDELITLVEGDQYYLDYGSFLSGSTYTCIQPGETGIMRGVQRGITTEDLESATYLEITPAAYNYPGDVYIWAAEPIISDTEVIETPEGYALSGTVTYSETIYNQELVVYPRDSRGLIVGDLTAYPGDLGSHPSGTTATFETEATSCSFVDFEITQSWISEEN